MIDTPMPPRIATLERDSRGYPVPFIILRDAESKPIFTANNIEKVWQATKEGLCHICGQKLDIYPWFVGGPGSAYLNGTHGAYNDGPLHQECLHYAMQVCPHLAQLMSKPVGQIRAQALREMGVLTQDNTTIPGTPEVFIAVQAWAVNISAAGMHPFFSIPKPFRKMEFWQNGQMMPKDEGERAAKHAARELAAKLKMK